MFSITLETQDVSDMADGTLCIFLTHPEWWLKKKWKDITVQLIENRAWPWEANQTQLWKHWRQPLLTLIPLSFLCLYLFLTLSMELSLDGLTYGEVARVLSSTVEEWAEKLPQLYNTSKF